MLFLHVSLKYASGVGGLKHTKALWQTPSSCMFTEVIKFVNQLNIDFLVERSECISGYQETWFWWQDQGQALQLGLSKALQTDKE